MPKVAFGGNAGHKPSAATAQCYNCGQIGHYAKDCKVPKAQVRAAHTTAASSNAESNVEEEQEELINDEEVPPEVEDPEAKDDAESIHIDGDKYITVDKAADKLQRPQYTPQKKECLVTYVEVNGHPAWMLWDSGSTTMGITPQFAHVNTIHVHELSEHLMLQLGTVGSRAMVQFGAEVKIKALGHLTKEYVDIANFDRYDMIIDGRKNATRDDSGEKLAPMASLPANSLAISEEEFQGTLKRGDGLDQSITTSRKAVIQPDKAQLPKKTRVKQVAVDLMECQPTSSRVKIEDLVMDEEEQSAASTAETTKSE
ncbi:hypothetical protein C0995_010836 [Termitomyces sp. Mi166|nr:hypothetical protein C0995_010836 [Termitomyces sp. Mi166\